MRIIKDNSPGILAGSSIVSIGNFDGVHRGHQALLARCRELSRTGTAADRPDVAVVTFEPLPQAWFRPESAPARISGPQQKLALLERAGVDLVWLMRFNQALAEQGAEDFVKTVICQSLRAKAVVVGRDFRFGRSREGDLGVLTRLGRQFGFAVEGLADVELDGQRVSSSAIRSALAAGEFQLAARLLGRDYTLAGEVISGQKMGRALGYPTANIRPEGVPCPLHGVYAVRARRTGEQTWRPGVASLGNRPAFGGGEFLVEVHLFDFDADLYGETLEVAFVEKIRNEQHFEDIDGLKARMKTDEITARDILAA